MDVGICSHLPGPNRGAICTVWSGRRCGTAACTCHSSDSSRKGRSPIDYESPEIDECIVSTAIEREGRSST